MKTKQVTLHAETTYTGPFWDGFCEIGDCYTLWIDEDKYDINFPGFKEWFMQADKYDPYSDVDKFQIDGFDNWIKQGYQYAVMLRNLLPIEIDVYYGFWNNFGDNNWRYCKAYITL
ncbi:MAG: hypothetical protein J6J06_03825 [Bacteroidaceae bacterium]|nr:hypothetical protein [Bacteroidaceae bacterium]